MVVHDAPNPELLHRFAVRKESRIHLHRQRAIFGVDTDPDRECLSRSLPCTSQRLQGFAHGTRPSVPASCRRFSMTEARSSTSRDRKPRGSASPRHGSVAPQTGHGRTRSWARRYRKTRTSPPKSWETGLDRPPERDSPLSDWARFDSRVTARCPEVRYDTCECDEQHVPNRQIGCNGLADLS